MKKGVRKVYCPFCLSRKPMWRSGKRVSVSGEVKQQYKCQDCQRQTKTPKKTRRGR